jgi:hypothetical protein
VIQNSGRIGSISSHLGKTPMHALRFRVKTWDFVIFSTNSRKSSTNFLKIVCDFLEIYFSIFIGSRPKRPPKRGLIEVVMLVQQLLGLCLLCSLVVIMKQQLAVAVF